MKWQHINKIYVLHLKQTNERMKGIKTNTQRSKEVDEEDDDDEKKERMGKTDK